MTTRIKATELSHIIETKPGKLEEIIVRVGDIFTLAELPEMSEATRDSLLGPHKINGFAPASYKNRAITDYGLFPLDMVARTLTRIEANK